MKKQLKKMMAKQIKDRLQFLIMAFCLVIGGITLAACGDDDDDDLTKDDSTKNDSTKVDSSKVDGTLTSELTMENFVGTWKITHCKSVEYNGAGEIKNESDESWENEKEYIVFYPDGRVCYYEYSEDEYGSGVWHEEGKTKLIIENGRPMFFGGDFLDPKILSLSGNEMTFQWTFMDNYDSVEKNTAKLRRESKRTDVLLIEEDD